MDSELDFDGKIKRQNEIFMNSILMYGGVGSWVEEIKIDENGAKYILHRQIIQRGLLYSIETREISQDDDWTRNIPYVQGTFIRPTDGKSSGVIHFVEQVSRPTEIKLVTPTKSAFDVFSKNNIEREEDAKELEELILKNGGESSWIERLISIKDLPHDCVVVVSDYDLDMCILRQELSKGKSVVKSARVIDLRQDFSWIQASSARGSYFSNRDGQSHIITTKQELERLILQENLASEA